MILLAKILWYMVIPFWDLTGQKTGRIPPIVIIDEMNQYYFQRTVLLQARGVGSQYSFRSDENQKSSRSSRAVKMHNELPELSYSHGSPYGRKQ